MPHFKLSGILTKAFRKALKDNGDEFLQQEQIHKSRRKFLQDAVILGAGLAISPSLLKAGNFWGDKKIVVIGAGMAGLSAAYQFKKMGINATVYEAGSRTGGRMYTMKNYFGNDITTDIGGEFVDAEHDEIISLCKELNLGLYDLQTDMLDRKTFYFDGKYYSEDQLGQALLPFVNKIEKDIRSLPEVINYTTAASFEKLDRQSIAEYITALGIDGWLYKFLYVVLTREYGMEASEQSALNFLTMFDAPANDDAKYELFGKGHEIFKIKGGSQVLTDALAQKLAADIRLKHQLVSIAQNNNDTRLIFDVDGKKENIQADYVVMTLPFTILRNIAFNADMPAQKRKCIDELGYGNSSKFIMSFEEKAWRNTGKQGYTFTDESFGCGWDSSQLQSNGKGCFTVFGGGNFSDELHKTKQEKARENYVAGLDKIYPGAGKAHSGKSLKFCWAKSPVAKAGYSSFKVGQMSTIAGWEAIPVGDIFFAGEHTSRVFPGYMNGAAETGRKAAEAIAAKILVNKKQYNHNA